MSIFDHPTLAGLLAIGGLAALAAIWAVAQWVREDRARHEVLSVCDDEAEPPPRRDNWPTLGAGFQ